MKFPWPRKSNPLPDAANEDAIEAKISAERGHDTVVGERSIASVNRVRSMRTMVSHALAFAVMAVLGGGLLVWYYSTQYAKAREAESAAHMADQNRSAGELKLPPLGRVDPPQPTQSVHTVSDVTDEILGPPPPAPETIAIGMSTVQSTPPAPPPKTPQQLELERKLSAPVMWRPNQREQTPADIPPTTAPPQAIPTGAFPAAPASPTASVQPTPAIPAHVLPTRRFLLAKGTFIDCTLETAIDSTFDGMVTCIGATDVYSADGKVVVLERGTKYIGEKRGDVKQGQARVYVLWNEARTPTGVIVNLASPGTDELGRTGLPGAVDTHFWDRFGAAILISFIDGTLQAMAASQQRDGSGTSIVMNPQGSRDVMTEVLKGTVAIPPTVIKNPGDRVNVMVARDVDFRSVYALRTDPDAR